MTKPKRRPPPSPFLYVNMAMTADGKIATANRAVSTPGSKRDQRHMMELRSTADAILAGARTVDLKEVFLGPGPAHYRQQRIRNGFSEYNLRVVVSGAGTLNPNAAIFTKRYSPIIILTTERAPRENLAALRAVADEVRICGKEEIDFDESLRWLRQKWKARRVLCEGGGELNDALFRAGVVDEVHLTICPKIFGGRLAPTIMEGLGFSTLGEAARLEIASMKRRGEELFLVLRVLKERGRAGRHA